MVVPIKIVTGTTSLNSAALLEALTVVIFSWLSCKSRAATGTVAVVGADDVGVVAVASVVGTTITGGGVNFERNSAHRPPNGAVVLAPLTDAKLVDCSFDGSDIDQTPAIKNVHNTAKKKAYWSRTGFGFCLIASSVLNNIRINHSPKKLYRQDDDVPFHFIHVFFLEGQFIYRTNVSPHFFQKGRK